jgi:ethanolamine ammonia-lyase small subunit
VSEGRRGGPPAAEPPERALERAILERTPARILVGSAGAAYRTPTQLELRRDHAVARDAVRAEIDLHAHFGPELIERWRLLEVASACRDKDEYLMRPDLGRRLADDARARVQAECPPHAELQVVIGDGLSAAAVVANAPPLLAALARAAEARGWSFGRPFFVRHCRVGVLNEVGDILDPAVVVLLIGERPGLRTAESLSAYMAWHPRAGHTDAERNLVCNIHDRGVPVTAAAQRIVALAERMRAARASGVTVKEEVVLAGGRSRLEHG